MSDVTVAVHGQGYAWSKPSLTISAGDTVRWSWEAPPFLNAGYRVFSVSTPSGTTYEGGAFNSGDTKTAKGESQNHRIREFPMGINTTILILILINNQTVMN